MGFVRNNEKTDKRKNRYNKIVLLPRSQPSRVEKLLSEAILNAKITKDLY